MTSNRSIIWSYSHEIDALVNNRGKVKILNKKWRLSHNKSGYLIASNAKSDKKMYYIHRLVYELFAEEIEHGYVIDHIDENKKNNDLENLRVITKGENNIHSRIIAGIKKTAVNPAVYIDEIKKINIVKTREFETQKILT